MDENGQPKVFYHGSPAQFMAFDKKKAKSMGHYGRGFYFSDSKTHAGTYGNTYEVYLNITNPLKEGESKVTRDQVRNYLERIAENEDYSIENYGTYDIDTILDGMFEDCRCKLCRPDRKAIFQFNDRYEDSMALPKEMLIYAKGNESEIQDAISSIEAFMGEGYVSVYSYEDSPAYARKIGRGKGTDSGGAVREVQKQLKASDSDTQFQPKLSSDRIILANALETTIDKGINVKDADIIKRYKAQINTITKAEKAELVKKIEFSVDYISK